MGGKVFFTLLGRLILNSFILHQQNTNHEKKLNRRNFMIQQTSQNFAFPHTILYILFVILPKHFSKTSFVP